MINIAATTAASLLSSAMLMLLVQHVATARIPLPTTKARSTPLAAFALPPGRRSSRSRFGNRGHRQYCKERTASSLHATIDDDALPETNVIERLELNQQFERWRFFQRLLEGELPPSDVEDVLLVALRAYLLHGPTPYSADNKNENGGNASPVLTKEQRSDAEDLIDAMVSASDGIGDSRFLHMLVLPPVDYITTVIDVEEGEAADEDAVVSVDPNALSILRRMEGLLPDPVEDEEAFQSSWDVVIDLHGREAVRLNEEALRREEEGRIVRGDFLDGGGGSEYNAENLQWRTLCTASRVLIHFDFLTKGALKEGTFA